jgi:hypothetical protein
MSIKIFVDNKLIYKFVGILNEVNYKGSNLDFTNQKECSIDFIHGVYQGCSIADCEPENFKVKGIKFDPDNCDEYLANCDYFRYQNIKLTKRYPLDIKKFKSFLVDFDIDAHMNRIKLKYKKYIQVVLYKIIEVGGYELNKSYYVLYTSDNIDFFQGLNFGLGYFGVDFKMGDIIDTQTFSIIKTDLRYE